MQGSGGRGSLPWQRLMLVSERVPAGLGDGASVPGPDVVFPALSRCGLLCPFPVPAGPGEDPPGLRLKPRLKDNSGTSDLGREGK